MNHDSDRMRVDGSGLRVSPVTRVTRVRSRAEHNFFLSYFEFFVINYKNARTIYRPQM